MSPSDDLHQRASELFLELCDLDPVARETRLAQLDDEALSSAVSAMLDADSEPTGAIDGPAFASIDVSDFGGTPRIPGYALGEKLGEGGMGVVWAAEQDSPRRDVALKLVRFGAGFESHRRRFEYEAQVLGWLNHPHIAQIYEAGVAETPSGPQPYFAMELVRGEPLDHYLHQARLSVREKLELFLHICEGVAHAHQRGVIHRDLKPGNILVQQDGRPKVLDFGVARAAEGDTDVTALRTATGEIVGTLSYMSPEQVRADPSELDGRSDVYALGVLLYQMLSGKRPFELGSVPLPEALRTVLEDDPPRLTQVAPQIATDLDTIVSKSMEKDFTRRYGSVDQLAGDVQRFLRDEPILARPNSTVYQVRKFVRRNRGLVAALTLIFLTLTGGAGVASTLYVREQGALEDTEEALEASKRSFKRLMASKQTFEGLLRSPRPDEDGQEVRMLDVLRSAAVEARTRFVDEPGQQGWLLWSLGGTFAGIGDYTSGRDLLIEARDLMLSSEFVEPEAMAELHASLGECLCDTDQLEEAEEEMRRARELLTELGDSAHPELRFHVFHASAYFYSHAGRPDEVEQYIDDALAAAGEIEGDPFELDRVRATALITRANVRRAHGNLAGAEETLDEVMELVAGRSDSIARRAIASRASLYRIQDKHDEAIDLSLQALDISREIYGEAHLHIAVEHDRLGSLYRAKGDVDGARGQYERSVEVIDACHPGPHAHRAQSLAHLGSLLIQMGQGGEAEEFLLDANAEYDVLGMAEGTMDAAFVKTYLAPLHRSRSEFAEARQLVEDAMAIKTGIVGPDHFYLIGDLNILGDLLVHLEEYEEAITTVDRALAIVEKTSGLKSGDGFALRHVKAGALVGLNRPQEALEALAISIEMVEGAPERSAGRLLVLADVAWCELHLGVEGADERFLAASKTIIERMAPGEVMRDNLVWRLEAINE